ncbi:PREDICTED: receptor-type tyrosine-protein phosphatase H [Miniopterus natalensis]|uniref:receptor-type tyrosine-protein phosphatase H n=1 Tax=Miniopterus natalensis TaxID=291302 RepID=UPI0007A72DB4|nr:PREDICTED: receptor-type tyrosine-protein phosphatase H [Miniopterus natalensis]
MAWSGGGLRAWGSLMLLGLCIWTGARAADPDLVKNLRVEKRTNSSISLCWDDPKSPNSQNYTYWVQWTNQGDKNETRNTTDTCFTADGLQPSSSYKFFVWAEAGGSNGTPGMLQATTAPNSVRNLRVEKQTNSSISLRWEAPEGPNSQNYTYWVQWTNQSDKNETRNTTNTSYSVEELKPATSYEFSVWAEKHGVHGSMEPLEGATAPNSVRNLSVQDQTNSSLSLRWEPPDGPGLSYTYWVQWTDGGGKTETRSTANTSVILDGLKPGSSYRLAMWVENKSVNSSWVTHQAATAPNLVRDLSMKKRSNSSITLSWQVPEGPDLLNYTYWVQWMGGSDGTKTQNTANTSVTVEGLEPGTLYVLSVWAEKNEVPGSRQNSSVSTVPNAVTSLRIQRQTTSSITLNWAVPQGPGLPPYTYGVSWIMEGSADTRSDDTSDTKITLEGMEAGSLYTFTIWAVRNGVNSDNETLTGATAPNEVTALQKKTQTNNSITLRWEAPADPRSHLYIYCIQWAGGGHPQREKDPQGHQGSERGRTNETWYVAEALEPGTLYNFSVWALRTEVASSTQSLRASTNPDPVTITSCISTSGGYGVILTWSCPPGGYEAFEFQVGGQEGSQDGASCGKDVPVSGLQPARSYSATVRTIWDGLKAPPTSVTCHTESAGVIAGAIVGVLLFIVLGGLLAFFLKKRYKKSQKNSFQASSCKMRELRACRQGHPSCREDTGVKEVKISVPPSFPGDILAADFAEHVRKKEKDSNCGFAEDYQNLALEGHGQSQAVASAPENSAKNRYRNVLPYDWSRVPLKPLGGEPGSDYINASFMPGLWSPQEFIATQGPLPQTVGDFWRLVWEQQSRTLVMLTNCVELGRVKCEHYWPLDTQPCTHGHLQVTLESEKVMENWTVRDLKLRHTQEQKTLSVRQFHYVAWPDHGVPHSPDPLLAFWKMLRRWLDQTPEGGPPIVHCSAGVGRTGTLIALDVLLRQLECEGVVGPFSFVKKMRESRPLMVQTEAQYIFLHQCILRFLQQLSPVPAKKGVIYENLLFENEAAIQNEAAIRAH